MATVDLILPQHRYVIEITPGSLSWLGERLRAVAAHQRAAIIVDETLTDTYGKTARLSLKEAGYAVTCTTMTSTERHKSLDTVRTLYDHLLLDRLERKSPVIALGGGVVGDVAGFVAATYLRGVPFVQCPTTLLAMVDASVGGKVGVNVPQGKNLIGAFHQPRLVLCDTDTLKSLPGRELRCGLAECVKHGVIRSPRKFEWLEKHLDNVLALDAKALVELVHWNVQIKAKVVMADEKEAGERAHLNFGHTFAHAIEAATSHLSSGDEDEASGAYHHGEAVSLGMVAATRLAVDAGQCPGEVLERLIALLDRIGLPTAATPGRLHEAAALIELMRMDKKVAGGRIRLVLPRELGKVTVTDEATDAQIAAAWKSLAG
ncbi:MAG: 3-dehydroquinate synthase [Phycisphaeraceae bacterium]|nr:3-dehydroquinate synthase [Phycisphaeraceae bacterium]